MKRKSSIFGDAKIKKTASAVTMSICMSMGGIAVAANSTAAVKSPDVDTLNKDFDALKKMAGEWQDSNDPKRRIFTYKVIANGSAVVETLYPGAAFEMVDVYTLDKGGLVMTHYCDLGNQPHLQARLTPVANQLEFYLLSVGNLPSMNELHTHDLKITFLDDNHVKQEWTSYKDGKPAETAVYNLIRRT